MSRAIPSDPIRRQIVRRADQAREDILRNPEWRGYALVALDDITRIALGDVAQDDDDDE